jgi:amino acid transporter
MLPSNPSDHSERSDLLRGLGPGSAIAIVVDDTIGTEVFLVASDMARAVGSATLVLIAWILGLLIVLLGAFCYAELGCGFSEGRRPLRLPWPGGSALSGDFFLAG